MRSLLKNRFAKISIIIGGIIIGLLGGVQLFFQDLSFETKNRDEVGNESAESFVPFESTSHGFRLHYPKNWEAGEFEGALFFKLKGAGASIIYNFDTLSEEKPIEGLIVSMKEQVTQYYQSNAIPFTFISEESMRMSNLPAYRWTIEYEREGEQMIVTQAWTAQNKRVHIFTLSSVKDQHETFLPVFLRMMRTFTLLSL